MEPFAQLVYGIGTVGKTYYCVSAFWDIQHQKALRKGKLITVGREGNPFLGVPEEARQIGNLSLRFRSPDLNDMAWLDRLNTVLTGLIKEARNGRKLEVLVFDGFSELNLLHDETFRGSNPGNTNRFAPYESWRRALFSILQRLDPEELGCYVLATARAGERKKAITDEKGGGKVISQGDNEELLGGFDYYPILQGGLRYYLPNYFAFVSYLENARSTKVVQRGQQVTTTEHRLHVLPGGGEFYVHCKDPLWPGGKPVLVNPTFDDFLNVMQEARAPGREVEKGLDSAAEAV